MSAILNLEESLVALGRGDVVAVPTDTVYGLAASLEHERGVATLFTLKGRPVSVAAPVLASSLGQIEALGIDVDARTRSLASAFWPGALTMVVRAPAPLAALVRSTTDTVGFRVPDDELLLGLLQVSGPLAVSSANDHGDAPCETPERVLANFAGREGFAGVLDDGERRGVVSTVLDISGPTCQVLREGAVALEALMEYLV